MMHDDDLAEAAPCGILATTADGTIRFVNRLFLEWTGYARTDLVDVRRFDELFTLPSRIYFDTHLLPLLRLQGFAQEIAADLVRHDGRVMPAFVNMAEQRGPDGGVVTVLVSVFEASERRRYERELLLARRSAEEAAKAKADFLAMFAHEVRNPLGAVLLQSQVLERRGLSEDQKALLNRMQASLKRVIALMGRMLEVSRLEAGKVTLDEAAVSLGDVVQAVVLTMGPPAFEKGVTVKVELDPRLPSRVITDPVKLEQVLTNLLGNAVKFTREGSVAVGANVTEDEPGRVRVRFWVRDTGIGIAPAQQARIFEPYVQADASIAGRFGGTGLGLSITKRLVETLGGKLELESEPGRGSHFWFELGMGVDVAREGTSPR